MNKMIQTLKSFHYYDELLELMFKNKVGTVASNIASPLFITYFLYDFVPHIILYFFLVVQFTIGLFRIYVSKQGLYHLKNGNKAQTRKYALYHIQIIFLTSMILGINAALAIFYAEPFQVIVMGAMIFALAAGSMSTITSVFHALCAFIFPLKIIFILSLFYAGTSIYIILGIILIVFILVTIPAGFRIYNSLSTSIETTIELEKKQKELIKNQTYILQSEKMASLGEMIGNIAHQWRQPLSLISTSASALQYKKATNNMSDEDIDKYTNNILNQAEYLSETIDTFREFIKDNKHKELTNLSIPLINAIKIVQAALKNHHIEIEYNLDEIENIKIELKKGELSQVIINILNNAKDILLEKEIENPWVKIDAKLNNDNAIISIEDNGGGIPEDIMKKVFEPYFTTKHKSKGTGLGLHMSYQIINESFNGNIYVKNADNGAKFYIEIPIK